MKNILNLIFILVILLITCKVVHSADALDEVNLNRQYKNLPPFTRDDNLSLAAEYCCKYRAKNLIEGHVGNRLPRSDFYFIPRIKGNERYYIINPVNVTGGCAAWHRSFDGKYYWGSCATYDRYKYAGAWSEIGKDGRRYMHLFVR